MRSVYSDTVVHVQEPLDDVFSEHVARASVRELEALSVRVGIRPHQISEGTFVWNFFDTLDLFDVLDVEQTR